MPNCVRPNQILTFDDIGFTFTIPSPALRTANTYLTSPTIDRPFKAVFLNRWAAAHWWATELFLVGGQTFLILIKIKIPYTNSIKSYHIISLISLKSIKAQPNTIILTQLKDRRDLWSISPTFYKQLLRQYSCAKKIQTLAVSTKKLLKRLLYEKAARKMLVKLTSEEIKTSICMYLLILKNNTNFKVPSEANPYLNLNI